MKKESFGYFIFKERRNQKLLWVALLATITQFIVFKSFYPFADFFSDSYSYIYAASANLNINIWPIGYSKFLLLFHRLTHSDTILVGFQYFIFELSCLYFFFTILYFYSPSKQSKTILFIFLFFNPLFLYITNYINSDPIFAALSMFWIVELIWIINRPKIYQVFAQAILLLFCFTVRNNAYYYPLISAVAFILSRQSLWNKLAGIALGPLFVLPFIIFEQNAAYKLTQTRQFSLFTGWQLANNALYMYRDIKVDTTALPSPESKQLNLIAQTYYKKVSANFSDYLYSFDANFFIKVPNAPLRSYYAEHYSSKNDFDYTVTWGKASIVFEEFGKSLIIHHPIAYLGYFMLPNLRNYFLPPLEILEVYNIGKSHVHPIVQDWFDYKTPDVISPPNSTQGIILYIFPYLFLFLNIISLGSILWVKIRKIKTRYREKIRSMQILAGCFLVANLCFCIFSTIIVFRYQFFPMIVILTFVLFQIEIIDEKKEILTPEANKQRALNLNFANI